ncbi:MAG TPA: hypothetical protein VG917_04380 [Patescibacteria group bacterium]|nr:hypothetical protein [Patescibacteria group bacterium]
MSKKLIIGIDFDKIFVNYPPFIPGPLIERFYKKKNHKLSYRIPGKIEQQFRILLHTPIFRQPIKTNISELEKIFNEDKYSIYLVSSRFSFLKGKTNLWNRKHKISKFFEKMYFNFENQQPHIFKDKIIKKENIKRFIDDDLDLLMYLSSKNPDVDFFWVTPNIAKVNLPKNIRMIRNLKEFRLKYL